MFYLILCAFWAHVKGLAFDKPKQFTGTSMAVRADALSRDIAEETVAAGFEPHLVVISGHRGAALESLAKLMEFPAYRC